VGSNSREKFRSCQQAFVHMSKSEFLLRLAKAFGLICTILGVHSALLANAEGTIGLRDGIIYSGKLDGAENSSVITPNRIYIPVHLVENSVKKPLTSKRVIRLSLKDGNLVLGSFNEVANGFVVYNNYFKEGVAIKKEAIKETTYVDYLEFKAHDGTTFRGALIPFSKNYQRFEILDSKPPVVKLRPAEVSAALPSPLTPESVEAYATRKVSDRQSSKAEPALISHWWLSTGYPWVQSFRLPGHTNPNAISPGSRLQLDALRGVIFAELGVMPGFWQVLPWGMRWAATVQGFYAQGGMSQYSPESPNISFVNLASIGAGFRVTRTFSINRSFSISPYFAYSTHYQRYYLKINTGFLEALALMPEIGLNTSFKFSPASSWQMVLGLAAAGFFYYDQNLSFAKISLGVEYVVQ